MSNRSKGYMQDLKSFTDEASVSFNKEDLIESAYGLYKNALHNLNKTLLIGNEDIRLDSSYLINFGTISSEEAQATYHNILAGYQRKGGLIENKSKEEKKALKNLENMIKDEGKNFKFPANHSTKGAILATENWSLLNNYALLLGSIHSRSNIYIVKDPSKFEEQYIWDEQYNRPRVLGRELYILLDNGYVANVANREYSFGLLLRDKVNLKEISLKSILNSARDLEEKTKDEFINFLKMHLEIEKFITSDA